MPCKVTDITHLQCGFARLQGKRFNLVDTTLVLT